MFYGARFCPHCGASAARTDVAGGEQRLCPRCQVDMQAISIGSSNLRECPQCQGTWVDAETLRQICADQEKQAAVLGMPAPPAEPAGLETKIRYLPCPVCRKLMNRVNFSGYSHIVLDVCKPHGSWLDRDELRRVVEFIRAGGLDKARARQIAQLEEERRRLEATRSAGIPLEFEQPAGMRRRGLALDLMRFLMNQS
jgi:Zn-finger nucleic acid-binding protein